MALARSRFLPIAVLAALAAVPLAASAQAPSYAAADETIHGTIASVQNANLLLLNDGRGFTDDVTLRSRGSVVSDGVRLEPGQRVTISGSAAGPTFVATTIATSGPVPVVANAPSYYPASAYYPEPGDYPAPVYYPAPGYYYHPISVGLFFHFR